MQALDTWLSITISFLASANTLTHKHTTTTLSLAPTSYESHFISHLRKDTSTQLTNFVISIANMHAYTMLAALYYPIKIKHSTTITIAGSQQQ